MIPDIAMIERLEDERYAAMLAKDVGTLGRLLHDDLVYMHSDGVADTRQSYLDGLRDGVWDYHRIKRSDGRVRTHDHLALVFCRLQIDISVRGSRKELDNRALAVWVAREGVWRLIAVQSGGIPNSVR